MNYDFYRRDVAGRPPANRSRSSRSSSRRKKFGGPQPQRNHRAQLRSHARHVHEDETEIDFPVGVPKGLTPPTSNNNEGPLIESMPTRPPQQLYCRNNYWRLGGESFRDPNREIVSFRSCVRAGEAKLCAMIPLWLGAAKLFSPAAPPAPAPAAVGGRTSRDVPSIKIIV